MPRQRRSGQEADVWRISLAGQRASNGHVDGIIAEVDALFGALPDGLLTEGDRQRIMRDVDTILAREFGTSRLTAEESAFYRLYLTHLDAAAQAPALRAIADIERIIAQAEANRAAAIQAGLMIGTDRFARVYQAVHGPIAQGVRLRNVGLFDPQRRWVTGSRLRLSDRVWLRGRIVRRGIDKHIRDAIRNGTGAKTAARDVRKYLNGGEGKHAAERLMRTEIQRVHAESTREVGEVTPGVRGLKYNLSLSHPLVDICDDHARGHSAGMRPGEYVHSEFPRIPQHPNCLCFVTQVLASREELFAELEQMYREEVQAA